MVTSIPLVSLTRATFLRDGDGLLLQDGKVIRVTAAPEPLLRITCRDRDHLARVAWHLGNRHVPAQVMTHGVRFRDDPVIVDMVRWLDDRYGGGVDADFVNYYRDGNDSVAWHADRIGRHRVDPIVAICSLGGPRRFQLRPKGGGESVRFLLGSGDLLVMGGACQHDWEHCVPKMAHAPPRMSITMRHVEDPPGQDWWYTDGTAPA